MRRCNCCCFHTLAIYMAGACLISTHCKLQSNPICGFNIPLG